MKRTPIRRRTPLRHAGRPERRTALRRTGPPARRAALARLPLAPASAAQRAKVRGRICLVCGARTAVDAAHLVPRSLGGCDDADCVVALCRAHHRAYDRGDLDLVPYLEPAHRAEAAHAVGHLGLIGTVRRLSGSRRAYAPVTADTRRPSPE